MRKTSRLLLWSAISLSPIASAFPNNIRRGYNDCQTCHVSPTGGGVVTKYGKMTSEDFMSTWSYPGQASPTYGLVDLPDWIDIGGDVRQIEFWQKSDAYEVHDKFLMQADIEAAVHLSKAVTFVTSGGHYGQHWEWQRRRSYLLLNLGNDATLRIGRFFPAYGLMPDDHTKLFRRALGYDEGGETYNVEWSYRNEIGEIFLTRVFGGEAQFNFKRSGQVEEGSHTDEGATLRVAKYITKTAQAGLSFQRFNSPAGNREALGLYGMWGTTLSSYHLIEVDRIRSQTAGVSDTAFYQYGWELFQGFHWLLEAQYLKTESSKTNQYGTGIQWLITPHFEVQARMDKIYQDSVPADSKLLLLHYYF